MRRWAPIAEMNGRYLRVILLSDGVVLWNYVLVGRTISGRGIR